MALLAELNQAMAAVWQKPLPLSPGAHAVHAAHDREDHPQEHESDLMEAATSRASIIAMRLALLFAATQGSTEISEADMQGAWDVMAYNQAVVARLLHFLQDSNWCFRHCAKLFRTFFRWHSVRPWRLKCSRSWLTRTASLRTRQAASPPQRLARVQARMAQTSGPLLNTVSPFHIVPVALRRPCGIEPPRSATYPSRCQSCCTDTGRAGRKAVEAPQ